MMKNYNVFKIFIAIELFVFAISVNAQKSETIELDTLKSIEVIGRIDVNLIVSTEEKMTLTYESIERDQIDISNEKGHLKIKIVSTLSYKGKRVLVDLYFKELDKIGVYSSAVVLSDETITQDSIKLEAESGGEIALKLFMDEVKSSASTGGILNLSGNVESHTSKIVSTASLSAIDLDCKKYELIVNSKAIAKINVSEELKCKANSGGYVSYKGDPKINEVSTTLGGKIEKLEE